MTDRDYNIITRKAGRLTKLHRFEDAGWDWNRDGVEIDIGPKGLTCYGYYDSCVGIPGFTVPLGVIYEAMLKAGFRPEKHEKPDVWPY